jgi:Na+/melibiose symporter-like transporter
MRWVQLHSYMFSWNDALVSIAIYLLAFTLWLYLLSYSSDEAVVLLVAAGLITIIIVTALCYIRWHSKFSKSNPSESSNRPTENSQSITPNTQRYVFQ